jgi:hypothetical protein
VSTTNTEPNWQPARLIPIAGIRGPEEQEARATSAFLAVLRAVPEFGAALLSELGAPRGRFETFTEVRFKDALGTCRPDGAIVASRGAKTWRALVEVKTGRGALSTEQTNRYLDIARDNGFDCVLTISNEITSGPTEIPVVFDRRKARRVAIFHLSWVADHHHRRAPASPPWSLRSRPGLDPRGADRLPRPRELWREWLPGHGVGVGVNARRGPGGDASALRSRDARRRTNAPCKTIPAERRADNRNGEAALR